MSTSNSFSFTDTTESVITDAMSFLGKLGEGDTLTDSEYQLCLRVLNRMCKSIMLKNDGSAGMKMWQRQVGYLFLNSSSGQYVLSANSPTWCNSFIAVNSTGNNPPGTFTVNLSKTSQLSAGQNIGLVLDNGTLEWNFITGVNAAASTVNVVNFLTYSMNSATDIAYVIQGNAQPPQVIDMVNLRDSMGNDLELELLTYEQYSALPGKSQPGNKGDPVAVYYESHLVGNAGQGFGYLYTDVSGAVDLSKYLVVNFVQELQDWVNPQDEPDFPKEWFEALYMNLAKRLHPHFNAVWTQDQERMATQALKTAQAANPHRSSYRFSRGTNTGYRTQPPHR